MTHLRVGKGHSQMSKDAKMRNMSLRIDDDLRAAIEAEAKRDGNRGAASLVRAAVESWLKTRAADRGHAAA